MPTTTQHFLDVFPLPWLFVLTLALMVVSIEIGFFVGRRRPERIVKAQTSQVRAIMGAGLGLLAFILAFTFATGQSHYEVRVQGLVEETRLARTAWLQTEFLAEPRRSEARELLREYVQVRVEGEQALRAADRPAVRSAIIRSEEIHQQLWAVATAQHRAVPPQSNLDLERNDFLASVIGLIDMHVVRIEAALLNRIPNTIWMTLYLMAVLSMLVMGYQAGLVGRRSPMATMTLALAFSAVMMLITDLDRPVMSLFTIDNQIMIDLMDQMRVQQ
ncbi:hypothetical protein F3N42_05625 [Marinihelvus fidelis]|uniref:DUF4239 domain-containing protein n=1 Tax=Marinihelvus fidelis TaxID=2613842 RepID=A0A5N0TC78_9GAMM|nr:hypothetical protein [Marinihelvus fidelis]KAA9132693.1 hypothetical protein F3N42_05625 [Marinihelvus fidelis]